MYDLTENKIKTNKQSKTNEQTNKQTKQINRQSQEHTHDTFQYVTSG